MQTRCLVSFVLFVIALCGHVEAVCPGRTQAVLDAFGSALSSGNRSALDTLLHPLVNLTLSVPGRCSSQTSRGVNTFHDFLTNRFGAGVEFLWMPTMQLQSYVTAAAILHVAAFTNLTNNTNTYVNTKVVVAIRVDPQWRVIIDLAWFEDTSTASNDSAALKALFWKLMNTSQTAQEGALQLLYATNLAYYPMLCGSLWPPFPINKNETMRVANQSYIGQQLDTSRVDFLLISCNTIVATFVNVYVGADGRKMTLQDFDFWFVDPSYRVTLWWEFGLMLRQPAV